MTASVLKLHPIRGVSGTVTLPGSKSLSNRMLLLSAIAEGETELANVLDSDDVAVMVTALRQLGVEVEGSLTEGRLTVKGCGGPLSSAAQPAAGGERALFLGNAGTAMRPLAAVLTLGKGTYTLSGTPRMHQRPIGDLVEALRDLGADIAYVEGEGYPPLRIDARGLDGGETHISGATSSQFVTALLIAAPYATRPVTLHIVERLVSVPYVRMTLSLMERFGVTVERKDWRRFHVPGGQRYRSPGHALVEGDASSASYFLAGAAISGGAVRVNGCGSDSLQGDARFAEVLERMGAKVRWEPDAIEGRLGNPWAFADPGTWIKPYPNGALTHTGMGLMFELVRRHGIAADDIAAIRVRTNQRIRATLAHDRPRDGLQAKFSMPFALALVALEGRAGLREFTDATLARADVQAMIGRVSGVGFDEYMRTRVWEPAGMPRTALDVPSRIVPRRGHGYARDDAGNRVNAAFRDLRHLWAAGGIGSAALAPIMSVLLSQIGWLATFWSIGIIGGGILMYVVQFILGMVSGMFIHEGVLEPLYAATTEFWRPELNQDPPDMAALMPRWIATGLVTALVYAGIYDNIK
ncbi:MAG: 3-phosphoshikimate 1-carboxyvinyltransferase, partial [SAR324 cluster bacterium]|nr:3-phosphoshikimate 1-carboxyvinyltransferase [SAR324 cluster bacterium]